MQLSPEDRPDLGLGLGRDGGRERSAGSGPRRSVASGLGLRRVSAALAWRDPPGPVFVDFGRFASARAGPRPPGAFAISRAVKRRPATIVGGNVTAAGCRAGSAPAACARAARG